MIIGLDFETTGLDTATVDIIEIALVLYTDQLEELDSYTAVLHLEDDKIAECNEIVLKMHTENGLWEDVRDSELGVEFLDADLKVLLDGWDSYGNLKRTPLLGNSVHFDRTLLRRFFPEIESRLSHRNVDVSSFNEMARRWDPVAVPRTHMTHRAIDDVRESARTLLEYRRTWLNPTIRVRLQAWTSKLMSKLSGVFKRTR